MESSSEPAGSVATGLARVAGVGVPEFPGLPDWVSWTSPAVDLTLLRGDETLLPIRGELFGRVARAILPELDGTRSSEVLARLPIRDVQPTTILFFLKVLAAHGFLEPGGPPRQEAGMPGDTALAALLAPLTAQDETGALVSHLRDRRIGLVSGGPAAEALFAPLRQWIATAFDVTPESGASGGSGTGWLCSGDLDEALAATDLVIVYASPYDPEVRQDINEYLLKKGARALYFWQEGATVYLGPTVIGGYTPCIQCLVTRRTAVDASGWSYSSADRPGASGGWVWQNRSSDTGSPERALLNARLAAPLLFFEVAKLLSGVAPPATVGAWLEASAARPKLERHVLLRAPRCTCADHHPGSENDAHA